MSVDWGFLAPPYQKLSLPSRGVFYEEYPNVRSGDLKIRAYMASEMRLIAAITAHTMHDITDEILNNCMQPNQIPSGELTDADAAFLMFWLRGESFSQHYSLNSPCPYCSPEEPFFHSIPFSSFGVMMLDKDTKEPISVSLPASRLTVSMKAKRKKAESEIQETLERLADKYPTSDLDKQLELASYIASVTHEGTEVTERSDIEKLVLDFLPPDDLDALGKATGAFRHGIEESVEVPCERCEKTITLEIPVSLEFFRPTRRHGTVPSDVGSNLPDEQNDEHGQRPAVLPDASREGPLDQVPQSI
jgi:hypothetical protein